MKIETKEGKTVAVFTQSDGTIVPDDGGYVLIDKDIKPNPDDKVYHPGTPIFAPSYKILATHGIPKLEGVPELMKVSLYNKVKELQSRFVKVTIETELLFERLSEYANKYKYTDADMERAIEMAREHEEFTRTSKDGLVKTKGQRQYSIQEIVQSIQIPERLELEVEKYVLGDTPKLKSDNEKIFLNC